MRQTSLEQLVQGKRFPPRDLHDRSEKVLEPAAARVLAAARRLTRRWGWRLGSAGGRIEAVSS